MLVKKIGSGQWAALSTEELEQIIRDTTGETTSTFKKNAFEFRQYGFNDPISKKKVYPNSKLVNKSFSVNDKGQTIMYGYCHEIISKTENGATQFVLSPNTPPELIFPRTGRLIIPKNKIDLLAYLLLYKECKQSPHGNKIGTYQFYNSGAEAKQKSVIRKKTINAQYEIMNVYAIADLKAYLHAKGFRQLELLEDEEIRNKVLDIATRDLAKFELEIKSSDITIKSDIALFEQYGIINEKQVDGKKEWRIGFGSERGDPICAIPVGADKLDVLAKFLNQNLGTYDLLRKELILKTGEKVPEPEKKDITKVEKPKTAPDPKANGDTGNEAAKILTQAVEAKVIQYDVLSKTVTLHDKEGNKLEEYGNFLTIEKKQKWEEQLFKHVSENPERLELISAQL